MEIDARGAPGRRGKQACVGIVHVHPKWGVDKWLSDTDYETFLTDDMVLMTLMTYGEGQMLMAIKTSATPNNLKKESVSSRLRGLTGDFINRGNGDGFSRVESLNKQVCTEFGLTLYFNNRGGDLMNRIEVTQ